MRAKIVGALLCVGFLICAGVALVLSTRPGNAQGTPPPQCQPWPEMKVTMLEKAGLFPAGPLALINDKAMLMLFASFEGERWALIVLNTEGMACVAITGFEWQTFDLKAIPHPQERPA